MNVNRKWWRSLLVVSVATMLVLAACSNNAGDSGEESEPPAESQPAGEAVTGEIINIGSSTVEPIMSIALEDFAAANPDVTYEVDGPGTGDGFAVFCEDGSDIANASRPIAEDEAATCADAGIEYVELRIGIDGLSVITSPENSTVTCLGFGDLYSLFGPESVGFENWSDADGLAAEVGGDFGELHAPYEDAAARHHRPRRGVGHVLELHRDRARRPGRGSGRGRRHHRGRGRDASPGLHRLGR